MIESLLQELGKLRQEQRYSEALELFIYYCDNNPHPDFEELVQKAKMIKDLKEEVKRYDVDYFLQ